MRQPTALRDVMLNLEFPVRHNGEDDPCLRRAALLPGFERTDCGGRVRLGLGQAGVLRDVLLDLWEKAKGRLGSVLRLDGQDLDLERLKEALAVLDCAGARDTAREGRKYCVPGQGGWNWGCRRLAHVPPWDGAGEIDKTSLKQRLRDEVARKCLELCPHFDAAKAEALADALPRDCAPPEARPVVDPGRAKAPAAGISPTASGAPPERLIPRTGYADVGGLDQAVRTLRETVELPLKHPEVLRRLGIAHHRGVLLYGPPGCGKTLLARALAHESGAAFLPVSGPELITKWHGESEEKLRGLFDKAQNRQPAIVFFDEIDAIAQSRSSDESLRLDSRFTTQLLTLLDGVHDLGRVFVLAATNRPDLLDRALLRPGRFDRLVEIPPPDRDGRRKILEIHARNLPLERNVDLAALAKDMDGLTGADIACLVREAAYACLRRRFDLDDLLGEPAALPEDRLRNLRVTARDFRQALAAVRKRTEYLNQ